ncbi:uncharacterized protein TNCV_960131 [Trichonephila clavipes]|nr:uncharacterized protein TNCV_960131 [Trichonephila clavipes]
MIELVTACAELFPVQDKHPRCEISHFNLATRKHHLLPRQKGIQDVISIELIERTIESPAGSVDQGSIGFELLMGMPCGGGSTGGSRFHVKFTHIRKYGGPLKIKSQAQLLGKDEIFSDPIGLAWQPDILVLKPSPCLHKGSQVYDWMDLDDWNSWFKSRVRDSNRSQDIVHLNKFQKFIKETIQKYVRNSPMSMKL